MTIMQQGWTQKGWVGFDLDGTLAQHTGPENTFKIGEPIFKNIQRLLQVMSLGYECRIFTARIDGGLIYSQIDPTVDSVTVELYRQKKVIEQMIQDWCVKYTGYAFSVTCQKDAAMIALYDDRAIQFEKNTGQLLGFDFLLRGENECRSLLRQIFYARNRLGTKFCDELESWSCDDLHERIKKAIGDA